MLLKSDILTILNFQQLTFESKILKISRKLNPNYFDYYSKLLIITGVQSSGKSTLLFQLFSEEFPDALYINFDHPRFYNFDQNDLYKLDEIIEERGNRILFFDEVQKLKEWNNYVSQKLAEGFRIVITGSDASITTVEINREFTGLINIIELFPFSFVEFSTFNSVEKNEDSVINYLNKGGFPAYLISNSEDYLNQLFDDLLVRRIAVHYGIRDLRAFKRLAIHLLSNVGKLITGNQLKISLGIKTTSTVIDYLTYLESAYLFFYVSKFSYSVRKQMVNPRKVYAVDTGLITANSASFNDSTEQLLENMVFLNLRKKASELYYYADSYNCDFVVMKKNRVEKVIQVCEELKQDNLENELNGLFEAMDFFELSEGTIVTMNQTDRFKKTGKVVNVVPFHLFV
ncbi:MAG: AAA family ATPase [Draconibacterium sp.]|nr:AAA family ATPase [Draconibacterium sp.]